MNKVTKAIEHVPFFVVLENLFTATLQWADIILPGLPCSNTSRSLRTSAATMRSGSIDDKPYVPYGGGKFCTPNGKPNINAGA